MSAYTSRSKAVATAATLLLGFTLAACATLDPAAEGTAAPEPETENTVEPAAETEPAEEPTLDDEPTDADAAISDIPLPDGHLVVDEQTDQATGDQTMLVHVPGDFEDHADFYREQLPAAGWTIESDEPTEGGFGRQFEATNGTDRVWIQCETFDAGTAIFISTSAPEVAADEPTSQSADVELPAGFPDDVFLPLFAPSDLMAGGDHGDGMWVLEYVTSSDAATVTSVIEQEIADKGWTIVDHFPEDKGFVYELDKDNYNLFLAILPERTNIDNTSLHYTLRLN